MLVNASSVPYYQIASAAVSPHQQHVWNATQVTIYPKENALNALSQDAKAAAQRLSAPQLHQDTS